MKQPLSLLFWATLTIYSPAVHSTTHEFVWGACSLSFSNEYNFTRVERGDGLSIKIKGRGSDSFSNSYIDSINTFECNDTTSTKKICAELEKLIHDIKYKNKKVTLDQLDDFLKK